MEAGYTGLWLWTGGEPVAAISCSLLVGELFRSLPRALGSPDPRIAALATCDSPALLPLLRTSHSVCLHHLPIAPLRTSLPPTCTPLCAARASPSAARLCGFLCANCGSCAGFIFSNFLFSHICQRNARFPLGRLAPPTRRRGAPCPPCRSCSVWFARPPATPGCLPPSLPTGGSCLW